MRGARARAPHKLCARTAHPRAHKCGAQTGMRPLPTPHTLATPSPGARDSVQQHWPLTHCAPKMRTASGARPPVVGSKRQPVIGRRTITATRTRTATPRTEWCASTPSPVGTHIGGAHKTNHPAQVHLCTTWYWCARVTAESAQAVWGGEARPTPASAERKWCAPPPLAHMANTHSRRHSCALLGVHAFTLTC